MNHHCWNCVNPFAQPCFCSHSACISILQHLITVLLSFRVIYRLNLAKIWFIAKHSKQLLTSTNPRMHCCFTSFADGGYFRLPTAAKNVAAVGNWGPKTAADGKLSQKISSSVEFSESRPVFNHLTNVRHVTTLGKSRHHLAPCGNIFQTHMLRTACGKWICHLASVGKTVHRPP